LGFLATAASAGFGSFSSSFFLENFPGFFFVWLPAAAASETLLPASSFLPADFRSFFLSPESSWSRFYETVSAEIYI
jgi:hypothetical protein